MRIETVLGRIVAKQIRRFDEKAKDGWTGWDDAEMREDMLERARAKLLALGTGKSNDPLKDAADLANFALFFYAIAEENPDGNE